MEKHIHIKKQIYEEMKSRGIELNMDPETKKAIEDEKLKKFMDDVSKKTSLKAMKSKSIEQEKSEDTQTEKEEKKKIVKTKDFNNKDYMINKIKEAFA